MRAPLLFIAFLALVVDTLAFLWLGGHLGRLIARRRGGRGGRTAAATVLVAALLAAAAGSDGARAQDRQATPAAPVTAGAKAAAGAASLSTRLAYVITGDAAVDATSRAGLVGLTQNLAARTAMDPGDPVGVDPARDELAFFPWLYVPVTVGAPAPGEAAMRRLDAFMKNGGTVVFDTRDALSARPGTTTPEGKRLREMLATLDVPELEPVPRDHVLTKTFYLLDRFPGRYAIGQTWVEALPPAIDGERRPARAGDGVSPIVITSNDLAAAWATGRGGEAMYPVVGSDPRQREMALRGGINMVMYTLTGNYKADQVHVPALLERLGQ